MGDTEVNNQGGTAPDPAPVEDSDAMKQIRAHNKSLEKELAETKASLEEATAANHGFAVDKFLRDNREAYPYVEPEDLARVSTQDEFAEQAKAIQDRRAERFGAPPQPASQAAEQPPSESNGTTSAPLHQVTQFSDEVNEMGSTPPMAGQRVTGGRAAIEADFLAGHGLPAQRVT